METALPPPHLVITIKTPNNAALIKVDLMIPEKNHLTDIPNNPSSLQITEKSIKVIFSSFCL
jgi:hypothetical protein